jgi:hypothetical protein
MDCVFECCILLDAILVVNHQPSRYIRTPASFAGAGVDAPTYDTSLTLPSGRISAAAIDVANDIAYWCAFDSGEILVYKVDLKSATTDTPAVIGTVVVVGAGTSARSIVLDLANGYEE